MSDISSGSPTNNEIQGERNLSRVAKLLKENAEDVAGGVGDTVGKRIQGLSDSIKENLNPKKIVSSGYDLVKSQLSTELPGLAPALSGVESLFGELKGSITGRKSGRGEQESQVEEEENKKLDETNTKLGITNENLQELVEHGTLENKKVTLLEEQQNKLVDIHVVLQELYAFTKSVWGDIEESIDKQRFYLEEQASLEKEKIRDAKMQREVESSYKPEESSFDLGEPEQEEEEKGGVLSSLLSTLGLGRLAVGGGFLGGMVGGAGSLAAGLLGGAGITSLLGGVKKILPALARAIFSLPGLLIATAIGALFGVKKVITEWDEVGSIEDFFAKMLDGVSFGMIDEGDWHSIFDWMGTIITKFRSWLGDKLKSIAYGVLDFIGIDKEEADNAVERVGEKVEDVRDFVKNFPEKILKFFGFESVFSDIENFIDNAEGDSLEEKIWNSVTGFVEDVVGKIGDFFRNLIPTREEFLDMLPDWSKDFFSNSNAVEQRDGESFEGARDRAIKESLQNNEADRSRARNVIEGDLEFKTIQQQIEEMKRMSEERDFSRKNDASQVNNNTVINQANNQTTVAPSKNVRDNDFDKMNFILGGR